MKAKNARAGSGMGFALGIGIVLVLIAGGWSPKAQAQAPAGPLQNTSASVDPFAIGTLIQSDMVVSPDEASFVLPNAWLRVRGAFNSDTRFITQLNLARPSQVLLEARVSHRLSDRFDLDAGVFMSPFSREMLTFPGFLPLTDRGRVIRELAPSWQLGAGVTFDMVPGRLQAQGGVFNGNGGVLRPNDNQSFMYVGRLEGTTGRTLTRTQLGLSIALSNDESLGSCGPGPGRRVLVGVDAMFDSPRIFFIGETIYGALRPRDGTESNPVGAIGRLGFRVAPDQSFTIGADYFDPDRLVAEHDDLLLAVAYSHYVKTRLRFLVEYTFAPEAIDTGRLIARIQIAQL